MARLTPDRIRAALRVGTPAAPSAPEPALHHGLHGAVARLIDALGADTRRCSTGTCAIVRRDYPGRSRYGRRDVAEHDTVTATGLGVLAGVAARRPLLGAGRVVYLDLETTGLSGGAATVAFLVGLGWFEGKGFRTYQFVLPGFAAERRMLAAVTEMLETAAGIVTFNGKSFDVPILESRFAYHRMPSPLDRLWHVDLLHPSRRLWQGVDGTLGGLERDIVGLRRDGDVPGAEIPGRYVAYLRGAAASLLEPVMEHNRLDLVSLGALTGWACRVIDEGPRSAYQALGLGRLLGKIGRHDDAVACYERAAGGANGASVTSAADAVSAEALYRLACYWRRRRRHAAAADAWRRLLELRYPPPQVRA